MLNFSHSKSKFGYLYLLTPQGVVQKAALTGSFITRKMAKHKALKLEIELLRAEEAQEQAAPVAVPKDRARRLRPRQLRSEAAFGCAPIPASRRQVRTLPYFSTA